MSMVGLYKLDDGENLPTNCFPVRSFYRQSEEGAGHWLVAHRAAEQQKYGHVQHSKFENHFRAEGGSLDQSVVSHRRKLHGSLKSSPSDRVLDGFLLMTTHHVEKPSDLCSVDISDRKLALAREEDFEAFDNVAYINASNNLLTLGPFRKFPILRELELSVNSLRNLTICPGEFPHLETLDLSYNSLSSEDVLALGLLPRLRVLHLTGNALPALPEDMACPYPAPAPPRSYCQTTRFCNLEVLILDDNKLSSPGVFTSLANLKRLKHLNLDRNGITEVPYLQQHKQSSDAKKLPGLTGLQADRALPVAPHTEVLRESPVEFDLPLPELRFLSLAGNKITEEEVLLAVALFPSLSELVIHSNPLTTQRSGDPPLLTSFLQNRLGIKVQRKETVGLVKPHFVVPVNPKRKVKTKIPKVPRQPLFLESAPGSFLSSPAALKKNQEAADSQRSLGPAEYKPLPPIRPSFPSDKKEPGEGEAAMCYREEDNSEVDDKDEGSGMSKDQDTFFMTQVNDLPESRWHVGVEEKEATDGTEQSLKEESVPDRYRGYEVLLDAKPDPDMTEPMGIQQNVRALEYALKHLLVYRDSKARLDCVQKPYIPKERKLRKLPPPKPRKSKGERVEEFLIKIKNRKTITDIPLANVLQDKDTYKKEYEEALILLREMKRQYQMVRAKAVEQAAQIERAQLEAVRDAKQEKPPEIQPL
nr:PREDICTED: X-ray radiation resistance-associated protein 1 isoform X1 [Lepisosteus oculatus]XP_015196995.1 PREDICTED: X-ray radiation resistance-associated protein 1 isoform X1 [Lepisosteus oculatus]XP_015196997.1 PREDICTED: X-ray radiation resistance-associated protein 1 isoform X1 [Lepisosteus oculatus]XP_015196998.1 PREDICTED: X-ray radiation resistance-associated protein 1 isoform X1 [Lepisosteus oculatus]